MPCTITRSTTAAAIRAGLKGEEALRRLVTDCGTHFDPTVVQHCIRIARSEMSSVFAATGVSQSAEL
jgi:HD-GYP domain-containing protein (c-di-GMP phosphodiesterase class II)